MRFIDLPRCSDVGGKVRTPFAGCSRAGAERTGAAQRSEAVRRGNDSGAVQCGSAVGVTVVGVQAIPQHPRCEQTSSSVQRRQPS